MHKRIKKVANLASKKVISQLLGKEERGKGDKPSFSFHSRCKGLKLNHLCFASDLLLFSKGDVSSVSLLLRAFATFSATSGLKANVGKSAIYAANVDNGTLSELLHLSKFSLWKLPFKYLGVPVASKKLNAMDCEILVDRITARVRTWGEDLVVRLSGEERC